MSIETKFNQSHPRMIRLRRQAQEFSFFQALRDIESVADGLPRLGHATSPSQEAVRIMQVPNLGFAANTIDDAYRAPNGRMHLNQRFFGMLGPAGALPLHLTELIRNRTRHAHDPTIQAFVDIFHHRMAVLFYRAWSSSRPAIQRDRPWQDRYATYASALAGYAMRSARNRDRMADETKWYFTGRFASLRRNPEGLEAISSFCLQAPVKLMQFQLTRLPIEPGDRSTLGRRSSILGRSLVLGRSVPDRQSCVELRVGPLQYSKFAQLMPSQPRRRSLEAIVQNYVRLGTTVKLRLVLQRSEVPKLSLGNQFQLGRNAWLHSQPIEIDPDGCCHTVAAG